MTDNITSLKYLIYLRDFMIIDKEKLLQLYKREYRLIKRQVYMLPFSGDITYL